MKEICPECDSENVVVSMAPGAMIEPVNGHYTVYPQKKMLECLTCKKTSELTQSL